MHDPVWQEVTRDERNNVIFYQCFVCGRTTQCRINPPQFPYIGKHSD